MLPICSPVLVPDTVATTVQKKSLFIHTHVFFFFHFLVRCTVFSYFLIFLFVLFILHAGYPGTRARVMYAMLKNSYSLDPQLDRLLRLLPGCVL